MKAIVCDKIFDGDKILENHAVVCQGDTIHSVVVNTQIPKSYEIEAYGNCLLAPGFIDVQVNGGGGVLFNDTQSAQAIERIGAAHRSFGTTSFMPTLISDSYDKMRSSLHALTVAVEESNNCALGIHFEGPFLSQTKRGAHSASKIRSMRGEDIELLMADSPGIRLLTVAPENVEPDVIKRLCDVGVKVSIGHSNANYEQVVAALDAGASCFTHLFNAMSGLSARTPGVIGAALECETSWCGIIVDGVHVHPAALKIALASKPKGKCFLVTDAMPTVGTDSDRFHFFGENLQVCDGQIVNQEGVLSGSHLNMAKAVSNCVQLLDLSIEEALRMASLYPAEFLGISNYLGRIRAGYKADLILIDEKHNVINSWKNGQSDNIASTLDD